MEADVGEAVEEDSVVDGVKGFRQIHRSDNGSKRATRVLPLIETLYYLRSDREEGGGTGVARGKTMLVGGAGEVNEGADEAFEDFGGGAEETNGAVRSTEVRGLAGFGDGENKGVFPDRG